MFKVNVKVPYMLKRKWLSFLLFDSRIFIRFASLPIWPGPTNGLFQLFSQSALVPLRPLLLLSPLCQALCYGSVTCLLGSASAFLRNAEESCTTTLMVLLPLQVFQTQWGFWWCLEIPSLIRSRVPLLVLYEFCKCLLSLSLFFFSVHSLILVPPWADVSSTFIENIRAIT